MTKRADLIKAHEAKLDDVWGQAVINNAVNALLVDRPNRHKIQDDLAKALAVNVEARAMASRAIAENPDLED